MQWLGNGSASIGSNAAGILADGVAISLCELFSFGIGNKMMKCIMNPKLIKNDIDTFQCMSECLIEILKWPLFSEGAPNAMYGASLVWMQHYQAHCTCIARVIDVVLNTCQHSGVVDGGNGSGQNESGQNLEIIDQEFQSMHTGRIMAFIRELGEHHCEAWLSNLQNNDEASLLRAISLTNLVVQFTSYSNRKISIETLGFWESFCEENVNGNAFSSDMYLQYMQTQFVGPKVLQAMAQGCVLSVLPNTQQSQQSQLSQQQQSGSNVLESIEEYRDLALDTMISIAGNWQGPCFNGVDQCVATLCNLLTQSSNNDWRPIEAILWLLVGAIDASDILEDDIDEDEEEEDMSYNGSNSTPHEPYTSLLNMIGSISPSFNATTNPYLLRTCGRLIERLSPILSTVSNLMSSFVIHICLNGMSHHLSRSDCCQAVYALSKNKQTCLAFVHTENAFQQWMQLLFHASQSSQSSQSTPSTPSTPSIPSSNATASSHSFSSTSSSSSSLFEILGRDTSLFQHLVIRTHVNFLKRLPLQHQMSFLRTTIQHVIQPLNNMQQKLIGLSQAKHQPDTTVIESLMEKMKSQLFCLSLVISGATPVVQDGIDMLHELYMSVIVPMSKMAQGHQLLTIGICTVVCSISEVLSNIPNNQLNAASNDASISVVGKGQAFAAMLLNDCSNQFGNMNNTCSFVWLKCLSSISQCTANHLLPLRLVLDRLLTLRSNVSDEIKFTIDNPCYVDVKGTIWYEWVTLISKLHGSMQDIVANGGSVQAEEMNLYQSASMDALSMTLHLLLPEPRKGPRKFLYFFLLVFIYCHFCSFK